MLVRDLLPRCTGNGGAGETYFSLNAYSKSQSNDRSGEFHLVDVEMEGWF